MDADGDGVLDAGDTAVTEYGWDNRNRLVEITDRAVFGGSPTQVVDYLFDVENRWIGSLVDSNGDGVVDQQTRFAYDGTQIVLQFDKAGPGDVAAADLSHRYLWQPDAVDQLMADEQLLETTSGGIPTGRDLTAPGTVIWPLADHLGTIRDLATLDTQTGTTSVVNHRDYSSFGKLESQTNTAVDSLFGFTGRPASNTTSLRNHLNRWTDPRTPGWMSKDPIDMTAGDANTGRYCGNSPTIRVDPMGAFDEVLFKKFLRNIDPGVYSFWTRNSVTLDRKSTTGWTTFWRFNADYYLDRNNGNFFFQVDETLSELSAALQASQLIRDDQETMVYFANHQLATGHISVSEWDKAAKKQAFASGAEAASVISELYITGIVSLNPIGDNLVTLNDIKEKGFTWTQILAAAPLIGVAFKHLPKMHIRLPNGRVERVAFEAFEKLAEAEKTLLRELVDNMKAAEGWKIEERQLDLLAKISRASMDLAEDLRIGRMKLLAEHPGLSETVATEAVRGAKEVKGASGAMGDIVLNNSVLREVTVAGARGTKVTRDSLKSTLVTEAAQLEHGKYGEIFVQLADPKLTQGEVLGWLQGANGMRSSSGFKELSGRRIRLFSADGTQWFDGIFR